MHKPADVREVFLNPGDFHFGEKDTRIVTLLGSCISITVWHPVLHIGGMCHFMLPAQAGGENRQSLDGRYADEAVQLLLHEITVRHTQPHEYQIKIFGGGNMFPQYKCKVNCPNYADIGGRNIEAARLLLEKHGFPIPTGHVGGEGHRKLIFNLWDGDVWVRHVQEYINQEVQNLCDAQ